MVLFDKSKTCVRDFLCMALLLCVLSTTTCRGANLPLPYAASTAFRYTGDVQKYVVPPGTTAIQIDACGAGSGGEVGTSGAPLFITASGGYISTKLSVSAGSTLYIYVGGSTAVSATSSSPAKGGYNGGGIAFYTNLPELGKSVGGGASDIRTENGGQWGESSLDSRLAVAGGAGSAGISFKAGGGGGIVGEDGSTGSDGNSVEGGKGGSQSAAGASASYCTPVGALGLGGSCAGYGYGAGGGGYYGGGASSYTGGGGSSYTSTTFLVNNVGDSRCSGDGVLYITVVTIPTGLCLCLLHVTKFY